MDDKIYYKLKGIAGDLEYLAKVARTEGGHTVSGTDKRKEEVRRMLANITRHVESIQATLGDPIKNEFANGEVQ